jgi:hypothetical protein
MKTGKLESPNRDWLRQWMPEKILWVPPLDYDFTLIQSPAYSVCVRITNWFISPMHENNPDVHKEFFT